MVANKTNCSAAGSVDHFSISLPPTFTKPARSECVCEVKRIKVHQQVPATVQHAELHIQLYTQKHIIHTHG